MIVRGAERGIEGRGTFLVRFSGGTAYQTCPLQRGELRSYERMYNLPVGADFDAFDPVTVAAVRPALQVDFAVVDDNFTVSGGHDGAPA